MTPEIFTFSELDARIEKIPVAPGESVIFPACLRVWEFIGICGTMLGLAPSLIILFVSPDAWMVFVAKIGLAIMAIGFLPGFVYRLWNLAKDLLNWRTKFITATDFAFNQQNEIMQWLEQFPKDVLEERLQFIRNVHIRMGDKLGLLVGSMEKLGIAPVVLAVITQVQESRDLGSQPVWQVVLAFYLILMYAVTISVSLMRLRAQLHDMLLTSACQRIENRCA